MKALVSIAVVAALMAGAHSLAAQESPSPMPVPAYAAGSAASAGEYAAPIPNYDQAGNGSVVTVPIPGGGEVRIEGPDLPPDAPLAPIETWGEYAQTPNTVMPSPMGP